VSEVRHTDPLHQWRGEFGARYMERNRVTGESVGQAATAFGRIVDAAGIRDVSSVLEVGANVGINLHGLRRVLSPDVQLTALEPNPAAAARLREDDELGLERVIEGRADGIDAPDDAFDLVFTNGVLIHIPPAGLAPAMREICRVARRFVLCSEYFSHAPVEVPYHGQDGMLWKRDFGSAYLEVCPALSPRAYGFLWQRELPLFDNLNWWVFEKPGVAGG
jgi:spore coat polysaccharide biosynthesis protein SpsF